MRGGSNPPRAPAPLPSWQFVLRAALVITGLTLLLVVDVHGVVFYIAWTLIVIALVSEAVAMLVYWQRSHRGHGS
jgi:hypothetical protein